MKKLPRIILIIVLLVLGISLQKLGAQVDDGSPSALDYYNSGNAKFTKGDLDGAIQDYDQAIALQPKYFKVYTDRAKAHSAKGDLDLAIEDYNHAISLNSKVCQTYIDRGIVKQDKGDLKGAIEDYNEAINVDPNNPVGYNNVAWILANAPDPSLRNGPKALEDATKTCELTGWEAVSVYGTMASAYAECGDFGEASKWEAKYLEFYPNNTDAQSRLALYKEGKPCHLLSKVLGH